MIGSIPTQLVCCRAKICVARSSMVTASVQVGFFSADPIFTKNISCGILVYILFRAMERVAMPILYAALAVVGLLARCVFTEEPVGIVTVLVPSRAVEGVTCALTRATLQSFIVCANIALAFGVVRE